MNQWITKELEDVYGAVGKVKATIYLKFDKYSVTNNDFKIVINSVEKFSWGGKSTPAILKDMSEYLSNKYKNTVTQHMFNNKQYVGIYMTGWISEKKEYICKESLMPQATKDAFRLKYPGNPGSIKFNLTFNTPF